MTGECHSRSWMLIVMTEEWQPGCRTCITCRCNWGRMQCRNFLPGREIRNWEKCYRGAKPTKTLMRFPSANIQCLLTLMFLGTVFELCQNCLALLNGKRTACAVDLHWTVCICVFMRQWQRTTTGQQCRAEYRCISFDHMLRFPVNDNILFG